MRSLFKHNPIRNKDTSNLTQPTTSITTSLSCIKLLFSLSQLDTPRKPPRRRALKKSHDSLQSQDSLSDCSSIGSSFCTHTDTIRLHGTNMKDTNRVLQQQQQSTAADNGNSTHFSINSSVTNGNHEYGGSSIEAAADQANRNVGHGTAASVVATATSMMVDNVLRRQQQQQQQHGCYDNNNHQQQQQQQQTTSLGNDDDDNELQQQGRWLS